MPRYKTIKLTADAKGLQGPLEQLTKLANTNPTIMAEFHSLFTGPNNVCEIAASVIVDNEIICTLTASPKFLEFLAERQ